MKTSSILHPWSGVGLLVVSAFVLPNLELSAQTVNTGIQRKATTSRDTTLGERLSNFFSSRPARVQQSEVRALQQQLNATRGQTQYYTPPASTYIPTQGTPQQVVLTNRSSNARATVIYQAPKTPTTVDNTRYLQSSGPNTTPPQGSVDLNQDRPAAYRQEITPPPAPVTPPVEPQIQPPPQPRPAPPPKVLIDKESLPVAKWSGTPGRVVSPYPPNHELDVAGLPSGSLARDPVTQLIFRLP